MASRQMWASTDFHKILNKVRHYFFLNIRSHPIGHDALEPKVEIMNPSAQSFMRS